MEFKVISRRSRWLNSIANFSRHSKCDFIEHHRNFVYEIFSFISTVRIWQHTSISNILALQFLSFYVHCSIFTFNVKVIDKLMQIDKTLDWLNHFSTHNRHQCRVWSDNVYAFIYNPAFVMLLVNLFNINSSTLFGACCVCFDVATWSYAAFNIVDVFY